MSYNKADHPTEYNFTTGIATSKYMQEDRDYKSKQWIRYNFPDGPSEANPYEGGHERTFTTSLAINNAIDTHLSGLYIEVTTSIAGAGKDGYDGLIKIGTAARWIKSTRVIHSNLYNRIDECFAEYCEASKYLDNYEVSLKHPNYYITEKAIRTDNKTLIFIPLFKLNSLFNSSRYFFTNMLDGNGELRIDITSNSALTSTLFYTDAAGSLARITNLYMLTLNLNNDNLSQELNNKLNSEKFVRPFKAYNYIKYDIVQGRNKVEVGANHQSVSHLVMSFITGAGYQSEAYKFIKNFQIYRGVGDNNRLFASPLSNVHELFMVTRECLPDITTLKREHSFVQMVNMNSLSRNCTEQFFDGFSTEKAADRIYVEFDWSNEHASYCYIFTIYDAFYTIDSDRYLTEYDKLD